MAFNFVDAEMPLDGASTNILDSMSSTPSQNSPILNSNDSHINLQVATIFFIKLFLLIFIFFIGKKVSNISLILVQHGWIVMTLIVGLKIFQPYIITLYRPEKRKKKEEKEEDEEEE
jgi:hypothetical protein